PQRTQYGHATSNSPPQAGQRSSPDGGCPHCGQKFTLRLPGSVSPQYGHWRGDSVCSANSKAAPASGAFSLPGGSSSSPGARSGGSGLSGGGDGGANARSPRRNRSAARRLRLNTASGNWRNSPVSGFFSPASRSSASRTSAGSSDAYPRSPASRRSTAIS